MKKIYIILFSYLFCSSVVWAQNKVSGIVTDSETGEALIGVSIILDGTTKGTITDIDGNYNLSVPDNAVLQFSFIGYNTITESVGSRSTINVGMKLDVTSLEEVVVVGYGTQKKTDVTGAVETVDLDEVQSRVITNASQVLQGKTSGVMITQNSGQPGRDDAEIRIRGVSSIENSNAPLVIIDGVQGELSDVHPSDIKEMTVLKDAASASIYGNRASNGVILITTKKGREGLNINYTGSVSVQQPTTTPKLLGSVEYAMAYNEAREADGFQPAYSEEIIERYREGDNPLYANTDWYDIYFGPAAMTNHYVNVSGGVGGKYDFSIAGGYKQQDGVLLGTSAEKFNYKTNINAHFLNNKLHVNAVLLGYTETVNELANSTNTVIASIAQQRPTAFVRAVDTLTNEPGLYSWAARYISQMKAGGGITDEKDNVKYQMSVSAEPVKGLTAKVLFSHTRNFRKYIRLVPQVITATDPFDYSGNVQQSEMTERSDWNYLTNFYSTLQYRKTFLKDHYISVMGGFESFEYSTDGFSAFARNMLANYPSINLGDPSTWTVDGYLRDRATVSYFGRLNYVFKDRYLLEGNMRVDYSSRFTSLNQGGVFPSASVGWRVSEEPFMKSVSVISDLKVRASWGILGNQSISYYYPSYPVMEPGATYSFGGSVVPGTAPVRPADNSISWEKSEQLNFGIDGELFDRFSFNLNYFIKTNTDNLIRVTLAPSLGYGTDGSNLAYQNLGEMKNEGLEVSLGYSSSRDKDLKFDVNVNLTTLKNKVVSLGGIDFIAHTEDVVSSYGQLDDLIRSGVGQQFGAYYGYVADGIYQYEDFEPVDMEEPYGEQNFVLKEGVVDPSALISNIKPGDIKYKDLNGDGKIDPENDRTYIGNHIPDLTYSMTFNINYKRFNLYTLIQGVYGTDAYIMGPQSVPLWNGTGNITKDYYENRWTPDNPSNTVQRLYADNVRNGIASSYYIQDASYLRVKNIQLSYDFPNKWLGKSIGSLNVFASIENAFTITPFKGFDPEKSFKNVSGDFHPQIQIYTFGMNLNL